MFHKATARFGLHVRQRLVHGVHRCVWNAGKEVLEGAALKVRHRLLDGRFDLTSLGDTGAVVFPVVRHIQFQRRHELVPLVFGAHADGEPTVLGLEGLVGHKVGMSATHPSGRDAG